MRIDKCRLCGGPIQRTAATENKRGCDLNWRCYKCDRAAQTAKHAEEVEAARQRVAAANAERGRPGRPENRPSYADEVRVFEGRR